jgi:flagellar basal-body rod protein FlgF
MESSSYIALSRMIAQEHALEVRATNIANAGTPGYKGQSVLFSDYLVRQNGQGLPPGGRVLQMVQDRATYRDYTQGQVTKTDNALDLALQGSGFFAVQTPRGERYTRAGRFSLSAGGQIVDINGYPVMGTDSKPMQVPPGSSHINVAADGSISADTGDVGKFKVLKFDDAQALQGEGGSLFASKQAGIPDTAPQIVQGVVEEANVQPIVELTSMMSEMRDFDFTSQFVDNEAQREQSAIDKIGHKQ